MDALALLYTHNLRGELDLLPKLHTFIRELKTPYASGELGEIQVLLLDLGDTCADGIWHCDATDNRSMVIGLDAIGYDAVNIQGNVNPDSREKLVEQLALKLIDDQHPHMFKDSIGLITQGGGFVQPSSHPEISINLTPQDSTEFTEDCLSLARLEAGQVGVVVLSDSPYQITHSSIHRLPKDTHPDPTIAGVVDFIISEARYYQKRKSE